MTPTNPEWSATDAAVGAAFNRAIELRGLFIQRYAGVEFAISHLLAFAYVVGMTPDWSSKHTKRLTRLTAMLSQAGPLSVYRNQLYEALDGFAEYDRMRHFLAHGMLIVDKRAASPSVRVAMYERAGEELAQSDISLSLDTFERTAAELHEYALAVPRLVARITRELGLPELAAGLG